MPAPLTPLPWDTEFFGRRIARLQSLDEGWRIEAERQEISCLYLLVDATDQATIDEAARARFQLVDLRVTFARDLARPWPDGPRPVRLATEADVAQLEEIAAVSHHDTRFYADQRFPRSRADELYRTWIRQSCAGKAGAVFVVDDAGQAAGYITCQDDGSIGLVAVKSTARRKGFGSALVGASLDWFRDRGLSHVTVVTQGRNLTAQKLYQLHGFLTDRIQLWYHLWL